MIGNTELDGILLSVESSRKELKALEEQLAKRHGLVGNDIREQLIRRTPAEARRTR